MKGVVYTSRKVHVHTHIKNEIKKLKNDLGDQRVSRTITDLEFHFMILRTGKQELRKKETRGG